MWIYLDMAFIWLTVLWILTAEKALGTVVSSDPAVTCKLDDDQTNEELERCLNRGFQFIGEYVASLKRKKRLDERQTFDKCMSFEGFDNCLTPLLEKCPSFRSKLHSHWRNIYDTIKCACSGSEGCQKTVDCYEEEQRGDLARWCDVMYKFNIKQNTRDKCHFQKENVRCKESLVTTACSEDAGLFSFHISKLSSKFARKRHDCTFIKGEPHSGFKYSEQCPANFTAHLSQCKAQFLDNEELVFHVGNDMVAAGKKSTVKAACRNYRKYKRCSAPIEDKCQEGIKTLHSYDDHLRIYFLKMEYICNDVKNEYMENLKCYREVLDNKTLSKCDPVWKQLEPMLAEVSAHQYYCLAHEENSQKLNGTLMDLMSCYESVFTERCHAGGAVIGALMKKAFQDPYYLGYKYNPDCELHRMPSTTVKVPKLTKVVTTDKPPRRSPKTVRSQPTKKKKVPTATLR